MTHQDPDAFDPTGATVRSDPGAASAAPSRGRRSLVDAVLFYEGLCAVYGHDPAALRAAKVEPPKLGKYPVHRVLGSGAKGAVLLGLNPDLDEDVAIKVVRRDGLHDATLEEARLRREGLVLAKLSHPNIVPILDAGVTDGDLFIVMRRIRGATLRDAQAGKNWRAVVELYRQAGFGLAAVHDSGLVHRDFKADNVLVDSDGRVMLADFGLVCLAGDRDADTTGKPAKGVVGAFIPQITRTGEIHGTPAYMAPEAFRGEPPSFGSDIFSFAASLFEALYGERPFTGDTLAALTLAVIGGAIFPRPADSPVPEWLDAVVRRALHPDAPHRPPTMHALLAKLDFAAREHAEAEARANRTRRRRFLVGSSLAVSVGLLLGGLFWRPEDPCADPPARLAGVWDPATSAGLAQLGDTGARLAALLDSYADAWGGTFSAVCKATHVEGTQSAELHDTRMLCLEQRKRELGAITRRLGNALAAPLLDEALLAATRLDSPRPCAQADRTPHPRAEQASEAAAIAAAIAGVRVRELGGAYEDSRALATELVTRARALGYEPLLAETLLARARTEWLIGAGEAARAALFEALDLAERHGLDTLAAEGVSLLTKLAALVLRDAALGHEWARQAERKLARIGRDDRRRAELLNNRGLVAYELDSDYSRAIELHEQALTLRKRSQDHGDESRIWIAESYLNLGNAQSAGGDRTGGLASYHESRRIHVELLGPEHPRISELLHAEAAELMRRGDLDEALVAATEALRILRGKPGHELPQARAHLLLSELHARRGDLGEALGHALRALAAIENLGPEHSGEIAEAYDRLGTIRRDRGEYALALVEFDAGLATLASAPAGRPAVRLALLFNRGDLRVDMLRFAEAQADFAAVDAMIRADERAFGQYRPFLLKGVGRAHLLAGQPAAAILALSEALTLLTSEGDAALRAELEFLLARALPLTERDRALALARSADHYYEKTGAAEQRSEVYKWIASQQTGTMPR